MLTGLRRPAAIPPEDEQFRPEVKAFLTEALAGMPAVWLGGAAALLHPPHLPGRGVFLHRHERAQLRIGPGKREESGRPLQQRVAAGRIQNLDNPRPQGRLHDRTGPHLGRT